jgi:DNA polymerase-3 subunit delta'
MIIDPSVYSKQQSFLEKAIKVSRISHAYLFSGPKGIGKKEIALWFAHKLNPELETDLRQKYTNLILIEPEGENKQQAIISIEQVLEIKKKLSLHSPEDNYRVVIIDQAQLMTTRAQNVLLKVLEEPYGKTVFILTADCSRKLLKTIYSRCQNVKFNLIAKEKIEQWLKKEKGLPLGKAEKIAWLSHGRWGEANDYLGSPSREEEDFLFFEKINNFCQSPLWERFEYEREFCSKRAKLIYFLEFYLSYLRDLILAKDNASANSSQQFNREKPNYSWEQLGNLATLGQEILTLLTSTNINARLALGQIIINL